MSTGCSDGNGPQPTAGGGTSRSHCVPPLPPLQRQTIFSDFGEEFVPLDNEAPLLLAVLEALLKRPASILHELCQGRRAAVLSALLMIILTGMGAYGLLMGTFSGGHQLWMTPIRVTLGLFLSALVCLPSLYIMTALDGAEQSLRQVAAMLCQSLALATLLMAGFAPVAWVFSQSTNTVGFMASLHLVFWCVAVGFALRLLGASLAYLNGGGVRTLTLWGTIFVIVVLQMCTTLRPLVGAYEGPTLQEKKFFLTHWGDTLTGVGKRGR